jgi:hypothetical protein
MRKILLLFILLVFYGFPAGAQAQTSIRFSTVRVDIWPEYDQPSVLVIYHYTLGADVKLPVSLDLRIPIQASINAVAVSDASGALITADYTRKGSGDWAVLTLEPGSRDIQVEYYDAYSRQGDTRSYTYTWPGDYPVDSFSISFQQPSGAVDLKTTPELGTGVVAADGLTYFNSDLGSQPANQDFTFSLEYKKSTDTLSTSGQSVQPSAPLDSTVQGRVSITDYLPWILGGLGALLVLAGVGAFLMYGRGGRNRAESGNRKRHAISGKDPVQWDLYCNQCGKRAQPGDGFCRTCGSRLQRPDQP